MKSNYNARRQPGKEDNKSFISISNMNINHNSLSCQAKYKPAYIFDKYITSYGKEEIGVICPHCNFRNYHGNINLEMPRSCFKCPERYLITQPPEFWTPPPVPYNISDVGEHPERYGLRGTYNSVEETADPGTEQFYKQQRIKLKFYKWPDSEIDELEKRQRKNFSDLSEYEHSRRILSARPKSYQDLMPIRKRLKEYLQLKNLRYEPRSRNWECPSHSDSHPSATLYENKNGKPLLVCHVCNISMDIFNVCSALTGINNFPDQVKEVKAVLGVVDYD